MATGGGEKGDTKKGKADRSTYVESHDFAGPSAPLPVHDFIRSFSSLLGFSWTFDHDLTDGPSDKKSGLRFWLFMTSNGTLIRMAF